MKQKVIIFGTGSFGEVVKFYLDNDSDYEVVAFTADKSAVADSTTFAGMPLVPFEDVEQVYPPSEYSMFIAVGYKHVNRLRADICDRARAAGYVLISYVSSKATTWNDLIIGDNCFVFEDNTIQPFVTIGDGVILWSGNHIGHHATIGDYCFITSHVVVSGHTTIGPYSFLGVNATIRDAIELGEGTVIGAGAIVMKPTDDEAVLVPQRTEPSDRRSSEIGM